MTGCRDRRWTARAALAVLLPGAVSAQDDATGELPRAKAFGIAYTEDGEPWQGAVVTFLWRPYPSDQRAGKADRVRVRSDARGRFRAMILDGRPYTVWARSEAAGGRYQAAAPVENVFPSVPVILRREADTRWTPRIRVTGREAWAERAPIRCRVLHATGNVHHAELDLDASGEATIPPLPGNKVALEVFGRGGFPLVERRIAVDRAPDPSPVPVAIPAPRRLGFAVRDVDTEKGIPGATIYRQVRARLLPIGETEADGFALLAVPATGDSLPGRLLALAEGYGMGGMRAGAGAETHYYCHLGSGETLRGRVLVRPGVPARGLSLAVQSYSQHFEETRRRYTSVYQRVVETDAEGRFTVDGLFDRYPPSLRLVLEDEHLLALPEPWRERTHPLVLGTPLEREGPEERRVITLDELCAVDLRITRADGVPADRVEVSLFPVRLRFMNTLDTTYVANRAGRLRLLLPPGDDLGLSIRDGRSWALHQLAVRRAKADTRPAELALRLPKPMHVSGRVVDGNGKAVPRVPLRCYPYLTGAAVPPTPYEVEQAEAGVGNRAFVIPIQDMRWFAAAATRIGLNRSLRTDADGRFHFPVPAIPMTYRLYGRHGRSRVDIRVEVSDAPVQDLEIEVRR